jgi:hypothetical protein
VSFHPLKLAIGNRLRSVLGWHAVDPCVVNGIHHNTLVEDVMGVTEGQQDDSINKVRQRHLTNMLEFFHGDIRRFMWKNEIWKCLRVYRTSFLDGIIKANMLKNTVGAVANTLKWVADF